MTRVKLPPAPPAVLRGVPGWLLWRREARDGRVLKVPYYVNGKRRHGTQGTADDRAQLVAFDVALTALKRGGYEGLGLAFLPGFGITGLDFDSCVDEDGRVEPAVLGVVGDTYAEVSPSGTGVHAIYLGEDLPNRKSRAADGRWGFEVFTTSGYMTWTGAVLPGWDLLGLDQEVAPVGDAVRELYRQRFGRDVVERAARPTAGGGGEAVPPVGRLGLPTIEAQRLLDAVDPDCGYDEWLRAGMALHHEYGADGFELWDAWSSRGSKYRGTEDLVGHWVSFGKGGDHGRPVTLRSLQKMAGPMSALPDEFPLVEHGEGERKPLPAFERDRLGRIEPTLTNAKLALERVDVCHARLVFDDFKHTVTVDYGKGPRAMTDTDVTELRLRLERLGFKRPAKELVRDAALKVAEDRRTDSGIDWGRSLRWDGVARVERFAADYLKAADDEYSAAVSLYWWTAHAGRLLVPGVKADMVPVLIGPQGCRKTTAVAAIAPSADLFAEINLEHRDDNLSRALRGKVVGELGELRGLATREAESIKAWLTRTHEAWTPKYMEFETTFARRLVFVGTTNADEFLADDSGERRWLPLEVAVTADEIDVEAIGRDRDQLWAEAVHLFEQGGVRHADAARLAKPRHAAYKVSDPWEERVVAWLQADAMDDTGGGEGAPRWARGVSVLEVLVGALGVEARHADRRQQMRVASILKRLGFDRQHTRLGKWWVAGERTGEILQTVGA